MFPLFGLDLIVDVIIDIVHLEQQQHYIMDLKRCGHSPYFQEKKDTKIECTDTDITKKESHEMSLTQRLIGNFKQSPYFRNKKNVKIEYDNNQTVKEENSEAPVETMVKKELRVELIPDLRGNHSKISGSRVPMPESSAIKSELLRPDNWETVLENIRTMRTKQDAPVDQLVAEHLSNKDCPPEVRRFQVLVTLMLSTQTKDQVTFAAMQRLKQHGLTCSNINETEEAEIARLIHPVGFWKRKASYIKRTAAILAEQYNGDIPKTVKEMCRLPGVGEKVAFITVDTAWHNNIGIGI